MLSQNLNQRHMRRGLSRAFCAASLHLCRFVLFVPLRFICAASFYLCRSVLFVPLRFICAAPFYLCRSVSFLAKADSRCLPSEARADYPPVKPYPLFTVNLST